MATYYVKSGGSDAASGLSHALAWATFSWARAVFVPGDIVQFEQSASHAFTNIYSTELNGVTFRSYDAATGNPGSGRATLNGANSWMLGSPTAIHDVLIDSLVMDAQQTPSAPGTAWSIIANDNPSVNNRWTIRNCILKNCGGSAVRVNGAVSQGWIVEDTEVFNTGDSGILFNHCGPFQICRRSKIHDTGLFNTGNPTHGLYSAARRCLIEDNEFYNNVRGNCISIREGGEVVRRNLFHDSNSVVGWFDYSDDRIDTIEIYDNIAYNIGVGSDGTSAGWFFYADPDRRNSARHTGTYGAVVGVSQHRIVIANNTIELVSGAVSAFEAYNRPTGDIEISNNVVLGVSTRALTGASPSAWRKWVERNNIFNNSTTFRWNGVDYTLANYQAAAPGAGTVVKGVNDSTASANVSAEPNFVPQAGSPAKNAGATDVVAIHYSKAPGSDFVFLGTAPDIGAVETV